MSLNRIARIVHSALSTYCETIGEKVAPWGGLTEDEKEFLFCRIEFHLLNLNRGIEFNPTINYSKWVKQMEQLGWVYSPDKSPTLKEHPNITSFDNLSSREKMKEYLLYGIVEAFYRCRLLEDL